MEKNFVYSLPVHGASSKFNLFEDHYYETNAYLRAAFALTGYQSRPVLALGARQPRPPAAPDPRLSPVTDDGNAIAHGHEYKQEMQLRCGWESLMKSVTLGNVTMSHRTREARRMPCVSLPLNYDRSAARC
ncbi:hypothetical protein EVAR_79090_1 [Eumeta japonica]|uniref:Uncharacterized protein n=1 Tax=Eumeta variegata TaxID=151549 RepID=A0A4C1X3M7_EUMVA|nr:hypothetical protein EVAR_79090_1 [Eumeta japonica]